MMGTSVTATRILFFWNISLVLFLRIYCSSSSTLFFSTEITYPKLIVLSYQDFFAISTEKATETKDRHGTGPIDQPMFSWVLIQILQATGFCPQRASLSFSAFLTSLLHTLSGLSSNSLQSHFWFLLLSTVTRASKDSVPLFLVLILYVFIGLSHPFPGINL